MIEIDAHGDVSNLAFINHLLPGLHHWLLAKVLLLSLFTYEGTNNDKFHC